MSAFEKILKLEQDFDNRKIELLEQRNSRIREVDEAIRIKREKLQLTLKAEVDQIRRATEQQVKEMQADLATKIVEDRNAFNRSFANEKEKIVLSIFNEVKAL